MSKLLTGTALAAVMVLSGAGFALGAAHGNMFMAESTPDHIRGSEFIGMRVYAAESGADEEIMGLQDNWEDVGEINDIVLGRDGTVQAVLVDMGGFLGIGERQVAVDMSAIKFVSDGETDDAGDFFLVIQASRGDLEGAPEYSSEARMTAEVNAESDSKAKVTTKTVPIKNVEEVSAGEAIEAEAEEAGEEMAEAAEATEEAAENAVVATGTAIENAAEATEEAAENAVREVAEETDETVMVETETDAAEFNREDYAAAEVDMLTTEDLRGARVYDENEEWIGEIDELTLTDDGKIQMAIIDVGGFLGIGEKPVGMEMDKLSILRNQNGRGLRVYVAATREELDAMPRYDD